MTVLEICLLVIGILAIVVSYFISDKNEEARLNKKANKLINSEDMRQTVRQQTHEMVGNFLENITDEVMDKTERQLDKLSNEKIMALHDYSETVLEQVDKNHKEVMFLYSMLDDKEKEIKEAVVDVQNTVKSLRKAGNILLEGVTVETRAADKNAIEMKTAIEETEKEVAAIKEFEENTEANPIEAEKEQSLEKQESLQAIEETKTKQKNQEIVLKLNKEGKSNIQIARELGIGVGEVKLIVDLFHEGTP